MTNLIYFIVPSSCGFVFFILEKIYKYYIGRKTDTRSRIKVEAQETHYEEDHNSRLSKSEDGSFLWKPISNDCSIRRKLNWEMEDSE